MAPSSFRPADHVVGLVDVGVNGAPLVGDAIVGRDGRAGALRAVFREGLDEFAGQEGRIGQQKAGGLCTLTTPAMPADLSHVFHAQTSFLW